MGNAAQFALEIDREWAETMEDAADMVTLIALHAFSAIVRKSPVDSGRFRGNWNAAIGHVDPVYTDRTDRGGAATIRRAEGALAAYAAQEGFPAINISNGLPYAERLETGYSSQAPGGMVALTMAEIQARFDGVDV